MLPLSLWSPSAGVGPIERIRGFGKDRMKRQWGGGELGLWKVGHAPWGQNQGALVGWMRVMRVNSRMLTQELEQLCQGQCCSWEDVCRTFGIGLASPFRMIVCASPTFPIFPFLSFCLSVSKEQKFSGWGQQHDSDGKHACPMLGHCGYVGEEEWTFKCGLLTCTSRACVHTYTNKNNNHSNDNNNNKNEVVRILFEILEARTALWGRHRLQRAPTSPRSHPSWPPTHYFWPWISGPPAPTSYVLMSLVFPSGGRKCYGCTHLFKQVRRGLAQGSPNTPGIHCGLSGWMELTSSCSHGKRCVPSRFQGSIQFKVSVLRSWREPLLHGQAISNTPRTLAGPALSPRDLLHEWSQKTRKKTAHNAPNLSSDLILHQWEDQVSTVFLFVCTNTPLNLTHFHAHKVMLNVDQKKKMWPSNQFQPS